MKKLALILATLIPGILAAAVPPEINFEGQFASTGTLPTIEFRIVDSPSSNVPLEGWSESTAPYTADGRVSLLLGEQTPLPEAVFSTPDVNRYLWVKVGTEAPLRQKLVAVPFAFRAAVADRLTPGATIQGGLTVEKDGGVLRVRGGNDQLMIEESDGPLEENRWIFKADGGFLSLLTASDDNTAFGEVMKVARSGAAVDVVSFPARVGVGTDSPQRELEVNGSLRVTGTGINKDIELNSPIRATVLPYGPNVPTNLDFQIRSAHLGTMQINNDNPGNVTLAVGGGKVGVGTPSPSDKLTVAGTVRSTSGGFKFPDGTTQATSAAGAALPSSHVTWTGRHTWTSSATFKNGDFSVGGATVVVKGGFVGIRTAAPGRELEVNGALRVTGTGINKDIELNSPIRATVLPYGPNVPTNQDFQIRSAHLGTMQVNNDNPGNVTLAVGGGKVGVGTNAPNEKMTVAGNIRLNDADVLLRGGSDPNHGLGWRGAAKPFAGVGQDLEGPVLFGWNGGGLGTKSGGDRLALRWAADGKLWVESKSAQYPAEGWDGVMAFRNNVGVQTGGPHAGQAIRPSFSFGNIWTAAGDGAPNFRVYYQDDTMEFGRPVMNFDSNGVIASVKPDTGSHFEGFLGGGHHPVFRLSSDPFMQLEMGSGDVSDAQYGDQWNGMDVALRRAGPGVFSLLVGSHTFLQNSWGSDDTEALRVVPGGNLFMNDHEVLLRRAPDANHGLKWAGAGQPFAGAALEGPVLFGWNGGALGARSPGESIALAWTGAGRVGVGTAAPEAKLHVKDGNILLDGTDQKELAFRRNDMANRPAFRFGRIINGGDGAPNFRIFYSDDQTAERTVLDFDNTGILASVRHGLGSHFEAFVADGSDVEPLEPIFRLNSAPAMQLEMGPGGNGLTDVAFRRVGPNALAFFNRATGEFPHMQTETLRIDATGRVGLGTASPDDKLDVEGDIRVNDNALMLRGGNDDNHGLAWFGPNKPFAGSGVEGPVLFGWNGGALGSRAPGETIALAWNNTGKVGIGTPSPAARLHVAGGDVAVTGAGSGVILRASNGSNCFRLTVDNAGALATAPVACP